MTQTTLAPANAGRRQFIVSTAAAGGGLLLGFGLPMASRLAKAAGAATTSTATTVNTWIQIGADESITILVGATDMGQGVLSGLAQIVAEELMVDWAKVSAVEAPANPVYGNPLFGGFQFTGGSTSVRGYYQPLRVAGAAAREMLVNAAAQVWGVTASACTAVNGTVVRNGTAQVLTYGALAPTAATLPVPPNPALTDPANFRLIGKPVARVDLPAKVDGSAIYGIDVRIDGMVYATVVHCPSIGGTCSGLPPLPPGATALVNLGNAVAVVANSTWAAFQGAQEASGNIQWSIPASAAAINTPQIFTQAQQLMQTGTALLAEAQGDVDAALSASAKVLDATYDLPYVAHATMEVVNCTANVTASACEIWAPTQGQTSAVYTAASITGLSPAAIQVHTTMLGGGLGRKIEMDFIAQAIQVSKTIGKPVKLTWRREEDFGHDQYRPMALVRVRAGLDASGNVTAWSFRNVSPSILGQRGYIGPTDVDSQAIEGADGLAYAFGTRRLDWVPHPAAVPVGFWRSVGNSINAFAAESAIDELALAAGVDPLTFRRQLLANDARSLAVLNAAATLAGWDTALPAGHARGIAFWASFGSIVCQVAEVSGTTPSTLRVNRVACVIDCGSVVNPDSVVAQMQGGIVHGMTAALWGKVTFANGVASARNFDNYRMTRMRDMPQIDVQVITSGAALGGVGEAGVPPIAPAIANAYATLTGQRLRTLPLTGAQNITDHVFTSGFE
ncbi:MAG TPA: molybdopterin cofactor-binding domain-containing protein [Rudaea sp.]|nr:molybdopterin cofactor-binding domain-containing protein [Rudaea sp.]